MSALQSGRYCSILWRCLIGRLCIILVCVVVVIGVSSKMVIQCCGVGVHVVTHGVQELRLSIRTAVIAIDAVLMRVSLIRLFFVFG